MMIQLDTENADLDLTSEVTVLTHTPSATLPCQCQALVLLGDGTKNLDGSGGNFEFAINLDSQVAQADPTTVAFSTDARACWWSPVFPVPANTEVVVKAKSPNGADTDVDVTAYLFAVSSVNAAYISEDATAADNLETACDGGSYNVGGGGVVAASVTGAVGSVTAGVDLADDAITNAKFDESTAFPVGSADSGATQIARVGADGDTLETLSDQLDDKTGFKLASDGLDSVSTTAPSGVASDFREMLVAVWRILFKKSTFNKSTGDLKTYADNGTDVLTTQSCSDVGGTETKGAAT